MTNDTKRKINIILTKTNGPRREKICLQGFVNNIGADMPAHAHSLFQAFIIRFSAYWKVATNEILIFYLVFVAKQVGLNLTLSETPDNFSRVSAQIQKRKTMVN